MALNLYIDVTTKTLVKGSNTKAGGLLPPFYFGSKVSLNIYPLIPNPNNDPFGPFIPASWSGYSIIASMGPADADDSTSPVAFQDNFTTISNGFSGVLNLNTPELKSLIGSGESVKTFLEIRSVSPTGNADVIFQGHVIVNGIVYDPGVTNVISNNLILHLPFNDNASNSTVTDATGNTDGILINGQNNFTSENHIVGKIGGGFSFDGVNDTVAVILNNSINWGTKSYTFAKWFNEPSSETVGNVTVFQVGPEGSSLLWYHNDDGSNSNGNPGDGYIFFQFNGLRMPVPITRDQWNLVIIGWDHTTGTLTLTINNVLINTVSNGPTIAGGSGNVFIGSQNGNANFGQFKGDSFRIYDKLLSTDEMTALWSGGAGTEN